MHYLTFLYKSDVFPLWNSLLFLLLVVVVVSRQFELCAYGLREVRRQWEHHDDDPPKPFLIN